jgi:Ca-activated chloride channel family protein
MHVKAHLDLDLVALEAADQLTLMLDLAAPITDKAKNRAPQAIQVVLDRSGSMDGAPLESAKGSVLKLVDRLAPQDFFGLVAFDDQALVVLPMRQVKDHHIPELRQVIRNLQTGGSTDISAGYLMGLRELSRVDSAGASTLLLISDGHANAGEKDPKVLQSIATKHATNRITTSTIGLGLGYDELILEALATGGGGAHRFASTVDEAVGAIAAEVNDLLDKSVVNAVLRVRPVAGLTEAPKIQVLQRLPFWKDGEDYVVQLGDLYAGENRRFVIGLEVPGITALGLAKVADIVIEYLNLAEMTEISVTMPVNVNVVPADVAAGRVPDPIVRAERLIIEAQAEKALATDEMRSGKVKEATNRLTGTAFKLRREASNIPVTDTRSAESLEIIKSEADEMDRLAQIAQTKDILHSSKRMNESWSRMTRSRKFRDQQIDTSNITNQHLSTQRSLKTSTWEERTTTTSSTSLQIRTQSALTFPSIQSSRCTHGHAQLIGKSRNTATEYPTLESAIWISRDCAKQLIGDSNNGAKATAFSSVAKLD